MNDTPPCPNCQYEYTYDNGSQFVCSECNHEWSVQAASEATETRVWKDAFGNELKNGDSVTVIKDLKVRGASSTLKAGLRSRTSVWSKATTTSTARSTGSARCS